MKRKMQQRSATRRLGLESLEGRDLMAGNVTVVRTATTLTITGDTNANVVAIQTVGTQFKVTGTGTTINGSATPKSFAITPNMTINMGAGSDKLTLGSLAAGAAKTVVSNNLIIDTGDGADSLLVQNLSGKNSTLTMGAATEAFANSLNAKGVTFTGAVKMNFGNGSDTLALTNSAATGTVTIDLGGGDDKATITNGSVGAITLQCGAGNDRGVFSGKFKATGKIVADGGSNTAAGDTADFTGVTSYSIPSNIDPTYKNFEDIVGI